MINGDAATTSSQIVVLNTTCKNATKMGFGYDEQTAVTQQDKEPIEFKDAYEFTLDSSPDP